MVCLAKWVATLIVFAYIREGQIGLCRVVLCGGSKECFVWECKDILYGLVLLRD